MGQPGFGLVLNRFWVVLGQPGFGWFWVGFGSGFGWFWVGFGSGFGSVLGQVLGPPLFT